MKSVIRTEFLTRLTHFQQSHNHFEMSASSLQLIRFTAVPTEKPQYLRTPSPRRSLVVFVAVLSLYSAV